MGMYTHSKKNWSHLEHMFSTEVKEGNNPAIFCSSYTKSKYILCCLFSNMFLAFLCILLVILLLKMALKHNAEMLISRC